MVLKFFFILFVERARSGFCLHSYLEGFLSSSLHDQLIVWEGMLVPGVLFGTTALLSMAWFLRFGLAQLKQRCP